MKKSPFSIWHQDSNSQLSVFESPSLTRTTAICYHKSMSLNQNKLIFGQELWSSGYDSCLKGCGFESQHRILVGHFFTLICCKNCIVCLKRPKINGKEAGVGPFFKKDSKLLSPDIILLKTSLSTTRYSVLTSFLFSK